MNEDSEDKQHLKGTSSLQSARPPPEHPLCGHSPPARVLAVHSMISVKCFPLWDGNAGHKTINTKHAFRLLSVQVLVLQLPTMTLGKFLSLSEP